MCGIAGFLSLKASVGPAPIETMTRTVRYRGPDDEGYLAVDTQADSIEGISLIGPDSATRTQRPLETFTGPARLYLGHRRLSILDLSIAGHQPMRYRDRWIIYNGEVYNYLELRQELKAEGYEFATNTDTEVILAAYDRWGEKCVTHFNGEWALCIVDTQRRTLFLSRDRYGIKPLYFFRNEDLFAFASEIKAILSLPFVPRALNREKAFHYLALFSRDHTEETLYEGIHQLMPGHNLSINIETGETRTSQYYALSYCSELGDYDHRLAQAYAADIRDLLVDAVRLRLRADVPVGTCLSGGLDSSAVVAIVAKLRGIETNSQVQNTFTASFPGEAVDESSYARSVAEDAGATSHFSYPSKAGYWSELPAILHHQDEPFGGPSVYAQWEVMRQASKHVKVVLDGQGGDEVFAGYRDYRMSFLANLFVNRKMAILLNELWATMRLTDGFRKAVTELKPFPLFVLNSHWKKRVHRIRYRDEVRRSAEILGQSVANGLDHDGSEHIDQRYSPNLNELLANYMTKYSLPHLLKSEDRNSMAHSVEARLPYTDYRLVDYVFSLPGIYKIHNGWTKWLLRRAMKDLLPESIVWRRDKLGFATPEWASRREEWNFWVERNFKALNVSSECR
jgi:asparagine synthase (glutamine-hydrolysing)